MKKIIATLSMFLIAFTAMVFTSCSSNDDDSMSPSSSTTQSVQFYCASTGDLSSVCNLEVTYTNEQGTTVTEPLNEAFTKNLSISKFPSNGSFKIHATKKADYTEQATYSFKLSYKFNNGRVSETSCFRRTNMKASQLDDAIEALNNMSWKWDFSSTGRAQ